MNNLKYINIKQLKKLLDEYLVESIYVYDSNGRSPFFDHLVICDCSNEKIVSSIATKLIHYSREKGYEIKLTELKSPKWVIIDFYNIVLHIFEEQERKLFNLDSLWTNDDEIIEIKDDLENDIPSINSNNDDEIIVIKEEDLDK